ncbi:leucine--tRNA ligase [Candidatus Woesearchaeota archaeon]|nr:leucine--tRNA ligase [Candidatus Woesearchaeota archaeon]
MSDFRSIQEKWQKKWKAEKLFEAHVDGKKEKFFITTPYPYISGSLHIGHARAVTEVDVYSRFFRMQGKNVLYPMAFHISGTPVLGISLAIENGDKEKIEQYKEYVRAYVPNEKEVERVVASFSDPWAIVNFFIPKMQDEYSSLGLGVDWRRSFTSGDAVHQKLVEWQFHKYKEKGYLVQGKYPVLYSTSLKNPVGEDDIADGDTNPVEKKEFTLMKFAYGDAFLVAATLRPDTLFGQTNLWVNPDVVYVKVSVDGEKWIVSRECAEKLSYQDKKIKIINEVSGSSLLGKTCKAITKGELIILPFKGCKPSVATGLVVSVPSSAVYDYMALKELQDSPALCKKYGLNYETVKKIAVIPIITSTASSTGYPAKEIAEKMKIHSLQQEKLLEEATKEVYSQEFHTGKLMKSCGKYAGMSVEKAQKEISVALSKEKKVDVFYETSRRAFSRDGGEILVAIVDNQWFLDFNAKGWKTLANDCLKNMDILPDKYRKQFEDVFAWLDKRPCARLRGLGTKLPFDTKWVIESLSDSTLYMTLYTIQDKIQKYKITGEQMSPAFFDYVFLEKGNVEALSQEIKVKKAVLVELHDAFAYWYPMDQRHTFPPHLANHLSFMIFAHAACFPRKYWPKKISFHGLIMSDGLKMSKSKGNVVTLKQLNKDYGADSFRAFLCNSTSIDGMMNWQSSEVERMKNHLDSLFTLLAAMAKNKKNGTIANKAFVSRVEALIERATLSFKAMNLRDYSNVVLYDLLREYQRAVKKEKNPAVLHHYLFSKWVRMLAPLCPHYAEELWSLGGEKGFVSIAAWPEFDAGLIDIKAEFEDEVLENLVSDVQEIQKLARVERLKEVKVIIAASWKYSFMKSFKKAIEKERNAGVLIKSLMDAAHSKEIASLIPSLLKNQSKIPLVVLTQKEEFAFLEVQRSYLEKSFGCRVVLEAAEKSKESKAGSALPSRAALVVS